MRYLALMGFAICRFSFAQIATSANATQFNACLKVPDQINTSPLYFLDHAKGNIAVDQVWLFTSTDLTYGNFSGTYQTNHTKFSANFNREGTQDYNSNGIGISIAQKLNKVLVLGSGISFSNQTALENRVNQVGFNVFSSYQLNNNTSLAFLYSQIGNFNSQTLAYNFRINTKISSGVLLSTINSEPIISGCIVYCPSKTIISSITMATGNMPFSGSVGIQRKKWTYTFKTSYFGNNLGFQPSFHLNYLINEQKSSIEPVGIDFVQQTLPSN